jgi:hypothetical protein
MFRLNILDAVGLSATRRRHAERHSRGRIGRSVGPGIDFGGWTLASGAVMATGNNLHERRSLNARLVLPAGMAHRRRYKFFVVLIETRTMSKVTVCPPSIRLGWAGVPARGRGDADLPASRIWLPAQRTSP